MNKRGVSPLMATLLLIAFSIGLGAIVMSYGETYVENQATFVQSPEVGDLCSTIDVQIISVKGVSQICVRDQVLELALDNGPNSAVDAIQARVVGSDDVYLASNILTSPLEPADSLKTAFTFTAIGTPIQVKLTPVVMTSSGQEFCSSRAIVVEDLRDC